MAHKGLSRGKYQGCPQGMTTKVKTVVTTEAPSAFMCTVVATVLTLGPYPVDSSDKYNDVCIVRARLHFPHPLQEKRKKKLVTS